MKFTYFKTKAGWIVQNKNTNVVVAIYDNETLAKNTTEKLNK